MFIIEDIMEVMNNIEVVSPVYPGSDNEEVILRLGLLTETKTMLVSCRFRE